MKQRGFSLIETIVALAIVGVVLTAFLSGVVSSYKGERTANVQTQAAHFAENLIELYRLRWRDPDAYSMATPPRNIDIRRVGRHLPPGTGYEVVITPLDLSGTAWTGSGQPPVQKVEVIVRSSSGKDLTHSAAVIPNPAVQ